MKLSIRNRIILGFTSLVLLFSIYGIITLISLDSDEKTEKHIAEIIDPALKSVNNFRRLVIESRMYTTNWVFLRTNEDDKRALVNLQQKEFPVLRQELKILTRLAADEKINNKINDLFLQFEKLVTVQKSIMVSLAGFDDYNDPVTRLQAEYVVDSELLPQTAELLISTDNLLEILREESQKQHLALKESALNQHLLFIVIFDLILIASTFLVLYFVKKITAPINIIRSIINDMGMGILKKVNLRDSSDEIGKMVQSVNRLSENLQLSSSFANAIGQRNFNMPFEPLSNNDTLGKSLIAMRDNLKQSDERLNEAQQIAKLGNWSCNSANQFQLWSDEVYYIFDFEPGATAPTSKLFSSMLDEENVNLLFEMKEACFTTGKDFELECQVTTAKKNIKDVIIMGRRSNHPANADSQIIVGTIQDITDIKKVERALKINNSELKKSNMELDKFVYSVSHDLRAPLSSVLGIIQIAEEETKDEVLLEQLNIMKGSIKKLDSFVQDILHYSRNSRQEIRHEIISFTDMLNDISLNLKYMQGNNNPVDIKISVTENGTFESDKNRISIVLNNLISNAIRYSNPAEQNPYVHVTADINGHGAIIKVKDNGIGIKKELQGKVFDMFYRVSENSTGSGLGLYIAKEIVSKLNGEILIESEPGKGSEFTLHLPSKN